MEQGKQRRVKVVDGATHRTGTLRAAVKPHKVSASPSVKQIIGDYVGGLKAGSLSQTYAGDTLTKNASRLRSNFGLAANDELYLLTDPTATGRAGMLLSASGIHLADGRGSTATVAWKDLRSCKIGVQNGMLVIGQSGVSTRDAKTLAALLQHIQAKLS